MDVKNCYHCKKHFIKDCSCEIYKCAFGKCEELADNRLPPVGVLEYCKEHHPDSYSHLINHNED